MTLRRTLMVALGVGLLAALVVAGALTRDAWTPWLTPVPPAGHADEGGHEPAPAPVEQVHLTPQAQSNLGLTAKPLKPETYWRTAAMPGVIVDRPGQSDRGVVAPVTG